jgi:hypothetical protein
MEQMKSIKLFLLKAISPQGYLSCIKKSQMVAFNSLRNQFQAIYLILNKYSIAQYTMPIWNDYISRLEKAFLPYPSFYFLRNPTIRHTMFVEAGGSWLKQQLSFLEKKNPKDKLKILLQEDYVGGPRLLNSTYLTSHNSIHHLYHLLRFSERTQCNFDKIDTIIEWGGGYGNMIKILNRLKSSSATYIIIDIPLFSCLQWLYLSTIIGKEKIHLPKNPEDTLQRGKINLLPVCFLDHLEVRGNLFISSWGLNESSKYSQDYVIRHNWFHSNHLLLGYQDSDSMLPDSDRVGKLAEASGAIIEDIDFLPKHHYAFR